MRKFTAHMVGIINSLADLYVVGVPARPDNYIPTALLSLAADGYVKVGKTVTLTAKGRSLLPYIQGQDAYQTMCGQKSEGGQDSVFPANLGSRPL